MLPSGVGVPNTDLYVYVTAENVGNCAPTGSLVLAYASNCQRDQLDRPTMGLINFCPTRLPSAVDSTYSTLVATATHELMHVLGTGNDYSRGKGEGGSSGREWRVLDTCLCVVVVVRCGAGFEAGSWPLFRDSTGAPRTPRSVYFSSQVSSDYLKYVAVLSSMPLTGIVVRELLSTQGLKV